MLDDIPEQVGALFAAMKVFAFEDTKSWPLASPAFERDDCSEVDSVGIGTNLLVPGRDGRMLPPARNACKATL
jgi:hypothetical protein